MIQLRIEAKINESKQSEFEQSVYYIIQSKLQKYAAKNRRLFRDMDQKGVVKYTEEWDDMDKLKVYLQTDDFKCLIGAMNVLGDIQSSIILQADTVEDISEHL